MFFFLAGINEKSKELGRTASLICPACGSSSCMTVSVLYRVLHLFFIPVLRWDRRYFAAAPCCGAVFAIDPHEGREFETGARRSFDPMHMRDTGSYGGPQACAVCGETLVPGALFCHRCGRPVS